MVAWLGLVVVLAGSVVASRLGSSQTPDVVGVVELYGDGSLVIDTSMVGLRDVRVDAATVVRDVGPAGRDGGRAGAPVTLADLRPGRSVAVRLREGLGPAVAGEIDVWGTGR
jgi:hypothetical protein